MDSEKLRTKFLEFFKERGHTVVPSSSLLPTDPSVLLTTAGMQQFKKYFTGELDAKKDFILRNGTAAKGTASIQKSFRTSDIDEVGDERHLTFFEMMGNFSFGGYFKKEAIQYAYDFIVKELGLQIDYVSVFAGEPFDSAQGKSAILADLESEQIWKSIDQNIVVKKFGRADNFWGPTGKEGPCGPTTEIYVNGVEIWNIVFNQYYQHKDKRLEPLETSGIDTGMGLERLAMVSQEKKNVFETDLFQPLLNLLPQDIPERTKRVLADHARAIAFLISDGVRPSNKEQGYVLRKLIRRSIVHAEALDIKNLLKAVVEKYQFVYSNLRLEEIFSVFEEENTRFQATFKNGMKEMQGMEKINAEIAFKLYESYGLPYEVIKELGNEKTKDLKREDFDKEFARHQEISRAGQERKFGGHGLLLDTGELKAANEEELKIVTRLHTTTHLLQAALRKVLGENVHQAGSDITAERTRFDFTFDRKLTADEIKKTEDLINQAIEKDLSMGFEQMPFKKAIESGALYSPKEKYPEVVKVYTAKDQKTGEVFSKELCGGPHVPRTIEIGRVKIIKEEAASAGVRRIRAILV